MPKAAISKPVATAQRFEARLERLRSRLNWIVVYIGFDAAMVWGLRGQIKVKGEINGFAFRTSLFPTREGRHFLLINKTMQRRARAVEGNLARFHVELDRDKRTVTLPGELTRILKQDRSLLRWYDELNQSTRNYTAKWIAQPKGSEARMRRAEQIAERLLAVMDAERELPPILQVAFARHPQARQGWDAMSPSRKRAHLFGIFYYRTPDAQARRIDKMLDDGTAVAERTLKKAAPKEKEKSEKRNGKKRRAL
jgi:uncharacterized protein YdeI (YjbR/CyaY-like superfamily)